MSLLNKLAEKFHHKWRRFDSTQVLFADGSAVSQLGLTEAYRHRLATHQSPPLFRDTGFSLYSQHEEDGMILFLFAVLGCTNRCFVEMCAGDGRESNTANLLLNHRWTGCLFDGDPENVRKGRAFFSQHPATRHWPPAFECAWITRDNCNQLLKRQKLVGEVDLLSIDIDGMDYWLWEALTVISPRVVVLEFNHLWGPEVSVTVPYAADFKAEFTQYGSDYAGASLAAFVKLGKRKGYRLVGTNAFATNAFFVRNDLHHDWLPEVASSDCFDHPRARFGMEERLPLVKDKPWQHV